MPPVNAALHKRRQSPWRWLLYVALALVIALGLARAPAWLFAAAMGLSLAAALFALARLPAGNAFRRRVTRGMRRIPPSLMAALLAALIAALLAGGTLLGTATGRPTLYENLAALSLYGLAIALLPLLWRLGGPPAPGRSRAATRAYAGRWRLAPLMAGAALLLVLLQINNLPLAALPGLFTPAVQLALLVMGIALLVRGVGGGGTRPMRTPPPWSALALGAILLLALYLRLWDLGGWTHRFLDELHYASAVAAIWDGAPVAVLQPFSPVLRFTWLYPLLQSLTAWITGPELLGLRLASALIGTLQVAAVYALASQISGRRLALLAALVMAVFPAHVHFSHIGINNVVDPLFGTLGLLFLVRGLRSDDGRDWALSGAALGLTAWFYEGGRLFFIPFAALLLVWILLAGLPASRYRPRARSLLRWGLPLGLVAGLPMIAWWAAGQPLTPRLDEMTRTAESWEALLATAQPLETWLAALLTPLARLIHLADVPADWFYGARSALIMPLWVPLFVLGFGIALWRLRTTGGALIAWWLLGGLAGLTVLVDSWSAPRFLVLLPAAAIAIAAGMAEAGRWAGWLLAALRLPPRWRAASIGFAAAILIALPAAFGVWVLLPSLLADRPAAWVATAGGIRVPDLDDALMRAMQLPQDTRVTIVIDGGWWFFDVDAIRAYTGRRDLEVQPLQRAEVATAADLVTVLRQLPRARTNAIFTAQGDVALRQRIEAILGPPAAILHSPNAFPADEQYRIQIFPPETLPAPDGGWFAERYDISRPADGPG
jgi:4-amino-4-deoxy-L-arabinose transferase-like glycosyltransferase